MKLWIVSFRKDIGGLRKTLAFTCKAARDRVANGAFERGYYEVETWGGTA